jgi:hypothetical protein
MQSTSGGYAPYRQARDTSGDVFGWIGIVMGIIGFFILGIILGLVAIVFGVIAIAKDSKALGAVALVIGLVDVIFAILAIIWLVSLLG